MQKDEFYNRLPGERESAILRALVFEYIVTGKPVGSRSFVNKYSFSISPATMRNIMYDLEAMGYLMQPHTSAGRVPTDDGYRFYVDSLLESYDFSRNQNVQVNEEVFERELQLDKIFSSMTKMLANISSYSGVMLTPRTDFTSVKRIELVSLGDNDILLILVTRTGMVLNKKVNITSNVPQTDLHNYSNYLTNSLSGYALYDIKESIFNQLREERVQGVDFNMALDIAELAFTREEEPELLFEGIENLLKIPEMTDPGHLNSLLKILEEKNILRSIMEHTLEQEGVQTFIGGELHDSRVHGFSLVTTHYKIGKSNVGVVGVIGPTRMDYEKVVPLIDYTGRLMSDLLTRMSK